MQGIRRRNVLFTLGAIPWALAACGGGSDDSSPAAFDARPVVANLADNVVTAAYRELNAQAAALVAAVQALVASPTDEDAMDAAQAAWKSARAPWERSEGFLFGPADSLGIDPAIDSWPLNTPDLQAFVAAYPSATQADVANAGDDLRGFHALEYLLFGDGVADNDKAAAELTTAEASTLRAQAQAFKAQVQTLHDAWTVGVAGAEPHASVLKNPGSGRAYASHAAVLEEFVNGLIGIADELASTKLAEPLGASIPEADPGKIESQYCWDALTDFHNNLQSVMDVYTGQRGFAWSRDVASAAGNGLHALVSHHDADLAARVVDQIAAAQKKVALIKGDGVDTTTAITGTAQPLRAQIATAGGRALIAEAIAACQTLKTTLETNVLPLVGRTAFAS